MCLWLCVRVRARGCVEVAFIAAEGVGAHSLRRTRHEFEARVHDEEAVGADEFGEMGEAFEICFLCALNIEVVGVGGVDNRYVGRELVE